MQKTTPLILTLKIDANSQKFFNAQRKLHFPVERNFLNAHLTLFHQLPHHLNTVQYLENLKQDSFILEVPNLMNLGAGVSYSLKSSALNALHQEISNHFSGLLIPQDRQPYRPHITIQNKTTPEIARALLSALNETFEPFKVMGIGLDLWIYQGGPWEHHTTFNFT